MDNNTIPTSPTQWMDLEMPYYYQQPHFSIENPHECSTIITTSNTQNTMDHHPYSINSTISPENSSQNSGNDHHELISPKSSIVKPVRRRSRASKKTPTTLLNASIANFRALVQQHTGCHTSPMFNNQKGPINLSFGPSTDHEQNEYFGNNSIGEGSMNFGYYYNHEHQAEKYSKDNYSKQEEQESGTSASAGYCNSGNSKLSLDDYGW
ncbi:unnamed protein product [Withania somnifera]